MSEEDEKPKKFFGMALDPIHIGTGGYRLGRVDNTIVREPGTNIPKIPGTTINGCARTYSYYQDEESEKPCAVGKKIKVNDEERPPCGSCPVCNTYGYTIDVNNSKSAKVNFSDARTLFFPVHSMVGPVWVTSPNLLREINEKDNLKLDSTEIEIPKNKEEIVISKQIEDEHKNLKKMNLGWLYLDLKKDNNNLKTNDFTEISLFKEKAKVNEEILRRIVVVHEDIFDKIVNSNLEVRTSVSINPETGAAEEGALFTYEAIPRATILWFEISYRENGEEMKKTVKDGLKLFEALGVGGMSSRGFGRLKILNL